MQSNPLARLPFGTPHHSSHNNVNVLVLKQLEECRRNVRIFARSELRTSLDYRHPRTQSPRRLCQFEADVATTDNKEMVRDMLDVQRFDVGHWSGVSEPRHVRNARTCAHAQEDAIASNRSRAAVVDPDDNRLRCDEARFAHDQVDAGGVVPRQVNLHQVINHLSLPQLNDRHVDRERVHVDTECRGMRNARRNLRTVNDVLAGQAGYVRTLTSDQLSFDHGGAMSFLGERPRQILASLTAANDEDVVVIRAAHCYLLDGP
jgi:hypothetical protein